MRLFTIASIICCAVLLAFPATAHEFWISPQNFAISKDSQVKADLRVGQEFKGSAYSFNPNAFTRFDLRINGKTTPVKGRLGDRPALSTEATTDGLLTIIHETSDSLLSYTEWAKFVKFATHKDFTPVLDAHVARGLPKDQRFVEKYRRFAKSLVAVGSGKGADSAVGLRTEIIALDNPYSLDSDVMSVKVLLDGKPRQDVQVELFEQAPDGTVAITLHRTNAEGISKIPVKPAHAYLVDSVTMLPLDNNDPTDGPVWYSLWASLTFEVSAAVSK